MCTTTTVSLSRPAAFSARRMSIAVPNCRLTAASMATSPPSRASSAGAAPSITESPIAVTRGTPGVSAGRVTGWGAAPGWSMVVVVDGERRDGDRQLCGRSLRVEAGRNRRRLTVGEADRHQDDGEGQASTDHRGAGGHADALRSRSSCAAA